MQQRGNWKQTYFSCLRASGLLEHRHSELHTVCVTQTTICSASKAAAAAAAAAVAIQHTLPSHNALKHCTLLPDAWDSGASSSDDDDEVESSGPSLTAEQLAEVAAAHASDTTIDHTKDSIEIQLARRCLERSIPYFGICRGSQVLNVACGGTLYAVRGRFNALFDANEQLFLLFGQK